MCDPAPTAVLQSAAEGRLVLDRESGRFACLKCGRAKESQAAQCVCLDAAVAEHAAAVAGAALELGGDAPPRYALLLRAAAAVAALDAAQLHAQARRRSPAAARCMHRAASPPHRLAPQVCSLERELLPLASKLTPQAPPPALRRAAPPLAFVARPLRRRRSLRAGRSGHHGPQARQAQSCRRARAV